jgi:broad specificity phosphatase PhoE
MNAFVRERDAGYTYDMTEAEVRAAFPWLDPHWETFGPWFSRPPGGESLADVSNRAALFLDAMFRDRTGARVLVVTHGGTLRAFRFLLERWTFDDTSADLATYRVPNCSTNVYRPNPGSGQLELESLNLVLSDPR